MSGNAHDRRKRRRENKRLAEALKKSTLRYANHLREIGVDIAEPTPAPSTIGVGRGSMLIHNLEWIYDEGRVSTELYETLQQAIVRAMAVPRPMLVETPPRLLRHRGLIAQSPEPPRGPNCRCVMPFDLEAETKEIKPKKDLPPLETVKKLSHQLWDAVMYRGQMWAKSDGWKLFKWTMREEEMVPELRAHIKNDPLKADPHLWACLQIPVGKYYKSHGYIAPLISDKSFDTPMMTGAYFPNMPYPEEIREKALRDLEVFRFEVMAREARRIIRREQKA